MRSCAIAFSSALALGQAGCRGPSVDAGADAGAQPARHDGVARPDDGATAAAASPAAPAAQDDPLLTAEPLKSRSIGHTSYVLKLGFAGGAAAVFKPRSRAPLGDRRYRGEIAAWRLATALGLANVPRSEPRSVDAAALRAIQPELDTHALVDPDGRLRGAITPWIDAYRVLPLEQPAWRARWESWLTGPERPVSDADRAMAGAIASMLVFDYLTGNWDRWSGGNVAQDGATGLVLYVDNDGAFYDPPPADSLARELALLRRVVRFPRSLIAALRPLDETRLTGIFGEETPGSPLLGPRVVAGVDARRKTLLAVVDAAVRDAGPETAFGLE